MEYNNMTFVEALKYLADRAGIELPEQEISESARRASDRKAKLLENPEEGGGILLLSSVQRGGKAGT
jgi:DNA primase